MDHINLHFMTLNVGMSATLAGLPDLVTIENLDIVFLQEVHLSVEQIQSFVRGFRAVVNIEEDSPSKPGTAILWKEGIPVSDVHNIFPSRAQIATLGQYKLLNVYAPSGSDKAFARSTFFGQDLFEFLHLEPRGQWISAGDFNCVLRAIDVEGGMGFDHKKCPALADLVRSTNLVDVFRHMFPNRVEFTFHRANCAASRLDRFYIAADLLNEVHEVTHLASLSDHFAARMRISLNLKSARLNYSRKTYWKLNTSILTDESFLPSFECFWKEIVAEKDKYFDVADWWDFFAKQSIKDFCIAFSTERKIRRTNTKKFLLSYLKMACDRKLWDEVIRVKSELKTMLRSDLRGFVIRSRFKENAEMEKASLFHACKEMKNGSCNISALKVNNNIVHDQDEIEDEIMGFFSALFNGHHMSDLSVGSSSFVPDNSFLTEFLSDLPSLDPSVANTMHSKIEAWELDKVILECNNNKSPGLDGLNYEFYKSTWNIIGNMFLQVLQCQLDRVKLMDSDKLGATRLIPKVTGVPKVDELRPITLLNCDYRILSKILVLRLRPVLPSVIRSGQLCSVGKKNILFGVHNIFSTIMHTNQKNGKSCLLSLDFFKAYDRVLLSFLIQVMKKMKFSNLFCQWIAMLHDGAQTKFILQNGLSRAVMLSFSIRQGDPIAMLLYILYAEPLLVYIERKVTGSIFPGLKNVEGYCDDLNVLTTNEEDLLVVDRAIVKFESISGAILSRNRKCEVIGFGKWKDREIWPLHYVRSVKEIKVFGIIIMNSYRDLLKSNWNYRIKNFESALMSWTSRSLVSIYQRVQIINTFAMSRLYYLASILPLPEMSAKKLDQLIGKFIWGFSGKILRVSLEDLRLPKARGGLGLKCMRRMSKSLLLSQVLRLLKSGDEKSITHMGFWVGELLGDLLPGIELGDHCEKGGEYFDYIASLIVEAKLGELIDKDNWRTTTAKALCWGWDKSCPLSKVEKESSFPMSQTWFNLNLDCLLSSEREMLYLLSHNKLPVKERMFRIGRDSDPYCNFCLDEIGAVDCDADHFFTKCKNVLHVWGQVRRLILCLLDIGNAEKVTDIMILTLNLPLKKCPGVAWIVGTYVSKVWRSNDGRTICKKELFGFLRYKFRVLKLGSNDQNSKVEEILK